MRGKKANLLGCVFGDLVVIGRGIKRVKSRGTWWLCRCVCGGELSVSATGLKTGDYISCGCSKKRRLIKHGKSRAKIYGVWFSMVDRCTNPCHHAWHRYGGRGIKVCDKWRTFEGFYEDMGDPPKIGLTLDRINNDGDYEPGNCKWSTPLEQAENRSGTIFVEIKGVSKTLRQWSNALGIPKYTLYRRYNNGQDLITGK